MRPDSLPKSPARVPTTGRNSQGRTARESSSDGGFGVCAPAPRGVRRRTRTSANGLATLPQNMEKTFITRTLCPAFLCQRRELELIGSGRAYAKIKSRTRAPAKALASAGRYHTFVHFAADIPAIVEPFRSRSAARGCFVFRAVRLVEKNSCSRTTTRDPRSCHASSKQPWRNFPQCRPRIRFKRKNHLRRRTQKQIPP